MENIFLFDENFINEQKVQIICPICNSKKDVSIPRYLLKKVGLTTISIPKDTVCEHHFQIFVDANLKVRGYQKVDVELKENKEKTHLKCKLCDKKVEFDIYDESSYIKREKQEKYLGKNLCSYKLAHYFNEEIHVNTVLVDETGQVYDYLDTYSVKLDTHKSSETVSRNFYNYSEENHQIIEDHPVYNLFLVFNIFDHWIYEIVSSIRFNSVELINIMYHKMQEASNIYSETPPYMRISIADKFFHLWISGSNVLCVNLANELNIQWLNPIMEEFIEKASFEGNLISNCPRIINITEFFREDQINKDLLPTVKRIVYDDLLYSKIQIKYPERIKKIIDRLTTEFSIDHSIIFGFFFQNKSLIEYIRKIGDYEDFKEFIELIGFINRRKLLE
ncbi:MAG: hypothetical protein ACFFAS_07425 [Promethearchaeota archaeon]